MSRPTLVQFSRSGTDYSLRTAADPNMVRTGSSLELIDFVSDIINDWTGCSGCPFVSERGSSPIEWVRIVEHRDALLLRLLKTP